MHKVLLVDDDRIARLDLKLFQKWKEYGFLIAGEAENGYEALQKLKAEKFDLVFVDIKMPKIDGLGFLSALKERKQNLCVIIVSGYSDFKYARQAFKLGAFDYLLKPVNEESLCCLLGNVKKHLDEVENQNKLMSKTKESLVQSLQLPYSSTDEDNIIYCITEKTDDIMQLAINITDKIVKYYVHDCFKIATLLGNSYENLCKKLQKKIPYITDICEIEAFPEQFYKEKDDGVVVSWYIKSLSRIAKYITDFNLNSPDSVIRMFCEYLFNNQGKEISIESVAKEIGYSSKYVSKVFKEKTGESCLAYITRLKMLHAKNLVRSGKYKNYEISEILGYKTPDYFCAQFKKFYGVTPSKYKTIS